MNNSIGINLISGRRKRNSTESLVTLTLNNKTNQIPGTSLKNFEVLMRAAPLKYNNKFQSNADFLTFAANILNVCVLDVGFGGPDFQDGLEHR